MADRIAVLNLGVLEQVGTPQELYESPRNRFVAGFIGSPSMNFTDLHVQQIDGTLKLTSADPGLEVQLDDLRASAVRSRDLTTVTVGVRPEHLGTAPASEPGLRVSAAVDVIEFLGNDANIHVSAGGHDLVATVSAREPLKVGDKVTLNAEPWQLYLFDPNSGESLDITT